MMSEIEPGAVKDAHGAEPNRDPEPPPAPDSPRWRRLVPPLVLVVLLLVVVAAGVRAVAQRVGTDDGGGLVVADQQAIDRAVTHRQASFQGRLLGDGQAWSSASARGKLLDLLSRQVDAVSLRDPRLDVLHDLVDVDVVGAARRCVLRLGGP